MKHRVRRFVIVVQDGRVVSALRSGAPTLVRWLLARDPAMNSFKWVYVHTESMEPMLLGKLNHSKSRQNACVEEYGVVTVFVTGKETTIPAGSKIFDNYNDFSASANFDTKVRSLCIVSSPIPAL